MLVTLRETSCGRNQRDGVQVEWTGLEGLIISLVPEHPGLCTSTLPVGRRNQRDETWVEWTGLDHLFRAVLIQFAPAGATKEMACS